MELIQKEANRTDGPADEELISACMDLMERLQGREYAEDEARIAALNQRIADAIQKKKRSQERRRTTFRVAGAIAAVVILLVGIGIPLRWTWFKSWSTPDEQQHVIMGNEITVDMVATAIAENETKGNVVVANFSEFEEYLGFDPNIPSKLGDEWVADYGAMRTLPGYIKLTAIYGNTQDQDKTITCIINYYTELDYAYFSFEQNREGSAVVVNGLELYVSDNVERSSVSWYNDLMHVRLSGLLESKDAIELLMELLEGE